MTFRLGILTGALLPGMVLAQTITIPAGTRIFGQLEQEVTSDVKEFRIGDIVSGSVWRSVVVDGQTVIAAGAPMVLQVADIQKRRTFGRPGSVEVRAVSVTAADGSEIFLDGGYDKKGSGRIVLSSTLAALVVWPTLFIKGKEAVLEPGLVFDAAIPANTRVAVTGQPRPTIRIGTLTDLSVEVLYDDMQEGDRDLPLRLMLCDQAWVEPVAVTAVNDQAIDALEVEIADVTTVDDCHSANGSVDLKDLSEHFSRGFNRFSVTAGGETAEVVLDVEM